MPVYDIQAPDGSIISVDAPLPNLAMQGAQEHWGQMQAEAQKAADVQTTGGSELNPLTTGGANFVNTMLLHAPEHLQAGLDYWRGQSPVNNKPVNSYADALANVRAIDAAGDRQNPASATTGLVAGIAAPVAATLLTGGAASPALAGVGGEAAVAPVAAAAPGLLGRLASGLPGQMAKTAALGAGTSGVDTALQGGSLDDITHNALLGGSIGAVIPPLVRGGGAAINGASALGGKLSDSVGGFLHNLKAPDLPSHSDVAGDLGATLASKFAASKGAVDQAYQAAADAPGFFHKDAFNGFGNDAADLLQGRGFRPRSAPQAFNALDDVNSMLAGRGTSLQDVEAARKVLNTYLNGIGPTGSATDRAALVTLKNAFDTHLDGLVGNGAYLGPQASVDAFTNARNLYRQHASTFGVDDRYDSAGKAFDKILNGDFDHGEISNMIFGSSSGARGDAYRMAQKLQGALDLSTPDGQQAWEQARQALWQKTLTGDGGKELTREQTATRINRLLSGQGKDTAELYYTPQERQQMLGLTTDASALQKAVAGVTKQMGRTWAQPFMLGGALHGGMLGGLAGMGVQTVTDKLAQMGANNYRRSAAAILTAPRAAVPPRSAPLPSQLSLPVGVGYVGGQLPANANAPSPAPAAPGLLGR